MIDMMMRRLLTKIGSPGPPPRGSRRCKPRRFRQVKAILVEDVALLASGASDLARLRPDPQRHVEAVTLAGLIDEEAPDEGYHLDESPGP